MYMLREFPRELQEQPPPAVLTVQLDETIAHKLLILPVTGLSVSLKVM